MPTLTSDQTLKQPEAKREARLFESAVNIPENNRCVVIDLLNARLVDTIDLQTQAKFAHWNVKGPQFQMLHELFDDVAERQYTRDLLFSSIVEMMSLVVCRIQPSINAAYQKNAVPISVSLQAIYRKLNRIETATASALVRKSDERLAPVISAMGSTLTPFLPGYRTKILDGNHLPGTEHRIRELRTMRAGALPGQALVVFDPERMLAIDAILCEDGHAQERSLLNQVLETVAAKDLWIADRNFCTTDFLFGIAGRGGFFVIRQHAATLYYTLVGKRKARGRIETGAVFEQTLRATNTAGEVLFLRRVSVILDQPTRDGDTEVHLLTNLPVRDARAQVIANLYRRRWTIETGQADSVVPKLVGTRRIEVDGRKVPPKNDFGRQSHHRREPCAHPIVSSTATKSTASPPSTCKPI